VSSSPIIEVKNLIKHYPKVKAVNGISFQIPRGICFGLLGPNGAGKTTTIEMIEGITQPTSGEILFRGTPIGREFREKSGIQFQGTSLPDFLSCKEVLELFRSFYKKPLELDYLVKLCNLADFLHQDTHQVSGGQKQRILLAIALVNDPEVVFLDEPTTGLDPQARRNFWDLIRTIKKQNKTIILTTHYMEEAYILCDEIAIVDKGRIIEQGAPDVLLKQYFDGLTLEIPTKDFTLTDEKILKTWTITRHEESVEIQTNQVNEVLRCLIEANVSLAQLKVRSQNLEDLFLQLTNKGPQL
jgi:ABC-2 type transport system ATP-binding protein